MTKKAGIYNGEKTVSLISGMGNTKQLHVKNYIKMFLTPYTKINTNGLKT